MSKIVNTTIIYGQMQITNYMYHKNKSVGEKVLAGMIMISLYLLLMLFISKPSRSLMLPIMRGCTDSRLFIPLLRRIAIVKVSLILYSSNIDHSTIAFTISILYGYCILDVPTPCLVLLYQFRLGFWESLVVIL